MEESTWLKSVFQETEYTGDCPPSKRMKFSEVSAELHSHFPKMKYSAFEVSRLIRDAFPGTESKACGKSRQKHILGLERVPTTSSSKPGSSAQYSSSEPIEHEPIETESKPIEPEAKSYTALSYSDLLIENQQLKARVHELEKTSLTSLCYQADAIIHHKSPVTQGPSSLDSFHEFDLASIIGELQFHAPDLYRFYMVLGDTQRNQQEDSQVTAEEVKAISSMCSMLYARSARMKGLQLLVSIMLVARATSKQVCKFRLTNKSYQYTYRPSLC